eukprot:908381-Prorocentrum_minimum.AAC.5
MGHLKSLREFDLKYNDLKEPARTKFSEGLPKFLEFLREEETRLQLEEIERSKPKGVEVGSWIEYRLKVRYLSYSNPRSFFQTSLFVSLRTSHIPSHISTLRLVRKVAHATSARFA